MCQYIAHPLVPSLRRCVFVAFARWTHNPHSCHLACSLVQPPEIWICLHSLAVQDLARRASSREAVVDVPVYNQRHKNHRHPTGSRQVLKRKTRYVQRWGSRKIIRNRFKIRSNGFHSPDTPFSSTGTTTTRGTWRYSWHLVPLLV